MVLTLKNITSISNEILLHQQKIILFSAPMGAGKTTLIKEICRQLGSVDNLSSPTFQIVNEYLGSKGSIYHFDLYRIKNSIELIDIGIEDYLFSDNYCLIEWPDIVKEFLPKNYLEVLISVKNDERKITLINHK
ncbi:MAG: tRNA (adenosine(37)-N6)-threonylcarbamoyltransferase complex ATPase subunit type 1 TsaE [Bacteroidetes bacterium]|nr:tRNA (adenosine(37)-N6)-threonylcarbamoyltransferase complex ATPase subunit type 1 TsaE [Bacteroidota bacterium]